jgi:hypothetical protein
MDTQEHNVNSLLDDMKTIKEILLKVADNNDTEIKQTGHLRTTLFNLQLIGAHHSIPEIEPVAISIERIIDNLHSGTIKLVNHDRVTLHACLKRIDNFLDYQSSLCVFEFNGSCNCDPNRKPYCSKKVLLNTDAGLKIQRDFDSCIKGIQETFNEKYNLY